MEKAYSKGKEIAVCSDVRAARAPNHALIRILDGPVVSGSVLNRTGYRKRGGEMGRTRSQDRGKSLSLLRNE